MTTKKKPVTEINKTNGALTNKGVPRPRNKSGLAIIAKEVLKPNRLSHEETVKAVGLPATDHLAKAREAKKAEKAAAEMGAPVTPLTKLLTSVGFVFAASKSAEEGSTAYGYNHPDGRGALFVCDNSSTNIGARWTIRSSDGKDTEGKTAKQLAEALHKPGLASHVLVAVELLAKITKGSYALSALTGDDNYSNRMKLLKAVRGTDKVLAKETGINSVIKEFYAALEVPAGTIAQREADFALKCQLLSKQTKKTERIVAKVEKEQVKEVLKVTAPQREVHDNKPILPGVKKLSTKQQQKADDQTKAELAAQIARKRKQEEYTPLAVPRPEAVISVNLEDVCLLVDPANGITLLCLEKPNSQGAICVYNNGSRVAAGVVPTETLITLRREVSDDLVRDVNQLLHPLTAGVIVTPVAETHLTAVLDCCKESIAMATETAIKTRKFAAPTTASKANGKAEKAAPKTKPAKAAKAPKVGKTPKLAVESKITVLVKENPYREGSRAFASYEAIKKSKTVGDFKEKCTAEDTKTALAPKFTYLAWSMVPHGSTPALVKVV